VKYSRDMTEEEHRAWLDELDGDDLAIVNTPVGYRLVLLLIAYAKAAITRCNPTAAERLQFLEFIDGSADQFLTPGMIMQITPMTDTELEMVHEARSLDPPTDKRCAASFDMLADHAIFAHFARLNPLLLTVIRRREERGRATIVQPCGRLARS